MLLVKLLMYECDGDGLLLQAILGHPLALVKLGMFLRDVNALRHHREDKPTVIIGPADSHGNCLVVAVTKEPMSGQPGQVIAHKSI